YGIALDPAAGRVYWANAPTGVPRISFSTLNGTGLHDLNTTGAVLQDPHGLAIDKPGGRLYWVNSTGDSIYSARLDGSGQGRKLTTAGSVVQHPHGVAIDAAARRLYWTNPPTTVSPSPPALASVRLDGSGASSIPTGTATKDFPTGLAVDPVRT